MGPCKNEEDGEVVVYVGVEDPPYSADRGAIEGAERDAEVETEDGEGGIGSGRVCTVGSLAFTGGYTGDDEVLDMAQAGRTSLVYEEARGLYVGRPERLLVVLGSAESFQRWSWGRSITALKGRAAIEPPFEAVPERSKGVDGCRESGVWVDKTPRSIFSPTRP